MNQIVKKAGFGLGGLTLFGFAFVTFTALSGVPLHKAAVIGNFVPAPEEEEVEADSEESADPADLLTEPEVVENGSTVVRSFLFPAPYDAEGMATLQDELKGKIRDYGRRSQELRTRESELAQREADLEERYAELQKLRTALQEFELELSLKSEEVDRDDDARQRRERESWTRIAQFFEEGDVDEQIEKLLTYEPEDASRILTSLSLERARLLMDALPVDRYQDYVRAYRDRQVMEEQPAK